MEIEHAKGEKKGKIMLYALSTCGWCRKTKDLLNDLGVDYYFVYVDTLEGDDRDNTIEEIKKWNPRCSFPTLVIYDIKCIVGFKEDKLRKAI